MSIFVLLLIERVILRQGKSDKSNGPLRACCFHGGLLFFFFFLHGPDLLDYLI